MRIREWSAGTEQGDVHVRSVVVCSHRISGTCRSWSVGQSGRWRAEG
jgi:hypothetical protein